VIGVEPGSGRSNNNGERSTLPVGSTVVTPVLVLSSVAVRDVSTGGPLTDDSIAAEWTFAVDTVQKGDLVDAAEVQSALDASVCGITFELGQRYQLYAQAAAQHLQTSVCLGTTELASAENGPRCTGAPN
jgi:hypothetical protein